MKVLFVTSRFHYGDPSRGEGYEHQNFLPALRRLGHEVEVFDHLFRPAFAGFVELNHAFLERVESWRPEVILYVQKLYEIWTETWDIVRRGGIAATVNWTTDDSWKYEQGSRFIAKYFDACATTAADRRDDYARDGYDRLLVSQWAADATRLQPPLSSAACRYDVCFVGQRYGRRPVYVRALQRAGVRVDCFGYGWPRGPLAGEALAAVLRSARISLNFSGQGYASRVLPGRRQIKARVFEVPGAGGFLLSEWAADVERYYRIGEEIDIFRTETELVSQARYYLDHPEIRDACAFRAFERTTREHTYDMRIEELLSFAVEQHQNALPGTGKIDWKAFDDAASRHTVSRPLRMVSRLLTGAARPFVGGNRASRATRRLSFELSWRLLGESTYSSRGLPGRLFYVDS